MVALATIIVYLSNFMKPISILSHYVLPQQPLSRLVGRLAHSKLPFIKTPFIRLFASYYQVNMAEALQSDLNDYSSFSNFFTRLLKPDARPIDPNPEHLVSPSDGVISEIGDIQDTTLIQAKGMQFELANLLGQTPHLTPLFQNGKFATIYLAPKDYHRVHMPLAGRLREMIYVPGELFSVNFKSSQHVPNLFARNERVIAIFDTQAGPMAIILVGAMIVASIHTTWAGRVTPGQPREITTKKYENISLAKGQEMGFFDLGSTVIMLFGPQKISWDANLTTHTAVKMGQMFGKIL